MKTLILLISLNSLSVFAGNIEACRGYAINQRSILNRIELEKNRDLNSAIVERNRKQSECSDTVCVEETKANFEEMEKNILENEKNAIVKAYTMLANLCKTITN